MTSATAMLAKVRRTVSSTPAQSCGDQFRRSSKTRDTAYSRPRSRTISAGRALAPAPRRYRCRSEFARSVADSARDVAASGIEEEVGRIEAPLGEDFGGRAILLHVRV